VVLWFEQFLEKEVMNQMLNVRILIEIW